MSAHDWFGVRAGRGAGGRRATLLHAGAPGVARRRRSRSCARRAAARSTPTPTPCPGTYEAALRAAGGAVALVDALLGGEARRAA